MSGVYPVYRVGDCPPSSARGEVFPVAAGGGAYSKSPPIAELRHVDKNVSGTFSGRTGRSQPNDSNKLPSNGSGTANPEFTAAQRMLPLPRSSHDP